MSMNKERLAAFTDAIAAIVATIMVLELGIPDDPSFGGLWAERGVFLAYAVSYLMIYVVWRMHHDLFEKAEVISSSAFAVNGVWLFFLTLVPFTTAWVGASPGETVPALLYTIDLALWAACSQWLDHAICTDNPGAERDASNRLLERAVIYGGYAVCAVLSFVFPWAVVPLMGVAELVLAIRLFASEGRAK